MFPIILKTFNLKCLELLFVDGPNNEEKAAE